MGKRCNGCFEIYDENFEICPECGYFDGAEPREPNHLCVGTVLTERYIVGNVLGFGGFGITYKAWDSKLDSVVAIKEYYPSGIVNRPPGTKNLLLFSGHRKREFEHGLLRFVEEARNMTNFNTHRNIVNVYEYFEENNTAYIVMEFLDGCNLSEYIEERNGKLDVEQSVNIILNVCNALRDIHSSGIIHRDVSPDNIFVNKDGSVKLIDFGAARFSQVEDKNFTIILKPGFAPPEQYEQISDQSAKTDIYALGATMYYCITGEKPDESTNRKINDTLKAPQELDGSIESYLSDSIMKAMAIETSLRFNNIDEFERAIKKEIKVKDPKNEKKTKKTRRLVGVLALVLAFSVFAGIFFDDLNRKQEETVLKPATINVCYKVSDGNSEALAKSYEEIIASFREEYSDVEINANGYTEEQYADIIEQIQSGRLDVNLFISDDLSEEELDKMMDLTSVVYKDPVSVFEKITSTFIKKNSTGCYLLNDYEDIDSDFKQLPSGFHVPVIYINTKIIKTETDSIESYEQLMELQGENRTLVREDMKERYDRMLGGSGIIETGTVEEFIAGDVAFYLSDTTEFFEIRKMLAMQTGIPKMLKIDSDDVFCQYDVLWSINPSDDKAENEAAKRFLEYLLSHNAQSRLFGKSDLEVALPLNDNSLEDFVSVYSDLNFVWEEKEDFVFE